MRIRDMNPQVRIVARMWDDRLAQQIENFFNVEVLSASDLAAPAFAGAAVGAEITQNLHIAGREYSMIRVVARQGSFMDGATVDGIQENEGVDIVLLHRENGGVPDVHPDGQVIVRAAIRLCYSRIMIASPRSSAATKRGAASAWLERLAYGAGTA